MRCTCLIPLYNEEANIHDVLTRLSQVKSIDEIICVNDCSTDNSVEIIEKNFPDVTLIHHKVNQGKSAAVRTGIKNVRTELTLLFDADISGIRAKEIDFAVKQMKHKKADMLILRRDFVPINHVIPVDILISGERILPTNDLKEIFERDFQGYEMEFEINRFYVKNKKKIKYMLCSTKNTHKTIKWGMVDGMKRELDVFYKILVKNYGVVKYNIPRQYWAIVKKSNFLKSPSQQQQTLLSLLFNFIKINLSILLVFAAYKKFSKKDED